MSGEDRAATAAKIVGYALQRAQPGARISVQRHIRRAEAIAALIAERFDRLPPEWTAKACRWALEVGLAGLSPASRYDYYRSLRAALTALGRWEDMAPHLRGPWASPTGTTPAKNERRGRKSKLAGAHRRRTAAK